MMTDTERQELAANPPAQKPAEPQSPEKGEYGLFPSNVEADKEELFSFRSMMAPVPQEAAEQSAKPRIGQTFALIVGAAIIVVIPLLYLAINNIWTKYNAPPPPFNDLGTSNFMPSGLGGRLITKWTGKAEYQLHINPLIPQQLAGFSSAVSKPQHPISINLRLVDGTGIVICQKEVLFPFGPPSAAIPDGQQALLPEQTLDGGSFRSIQGASGKIEEIDAEGDFPCPEATYRRIASWNFSSNFPTVAEQEGLPQGQSLDDSSSTQSSRLRSAAKTAPLQIAPIEGDDVITSDNPSVGYVATSGGRIFLVDRSELLGHGVRWQVFPAAIHYRCDKKAVCILTRAGTPVPLHARLKVN